MFKALITLFFAPLLANANPAELSIMSLIYSALKANTTSQSYCEYENHKNHPSKVVEKLLTLKNQQQVCDALLKLKYPQLLIFYTELKTQNAEAKHSCFKRIVDETKASIEVKKQKLLNTTLEKHTLLSNQLKSEPTKIITLNPIGGPDLYHGDLPEKTIAFTFDDGPHPSITPDILKALKDNNVITNFFSVGKNIRRYKSLVKTIASEGHFVGNHSWNHLEMSKQRPQDAIDEVVNTFYLLNDITENWVGFFRYPYGDRSRPVSEFLEKNHVAKFYWNIDPRDWKIKDPDQLLEDALQVIEQEKRGILLLHDVQPQTAIMLPALITELKARGYSFAAFDEPSNANRNKAN